MVPVGPSPLVRVAVSEIVPPTATDADAVVEMDGFAVTMTLSLGSPQLVVTVPPSSKS